MTRMTKVDVCKNRTVSLRQRAGRNPVRSGLPRTCLDCDPDLVQTQLYIREDFESQSTGEGGPPLPGHFPLAQTLPLSAVFVDNRNRPAWPDRWFFCCTIQDGQQGLQALCCGVSGGLDFDSLPYLPSCLPAEVAGQFRSIGELNNARNYYPAVSDLQKQELLNHEEQENDHWSS